MTDTGIATPTHLIPVTVDTVDTRKKCQSPNTVTVTRMATPTHLIPVKVDTFEMQKMSKLKSDDSCKHGDPDPPDPCDC